MACKSAYRYPQSMKSASDKLAPAVQAVTSTAHGPGRELISFVGTRLLLSHFQPMQRISPHFVCPALLHDALRHTFACSKIRPRPLRVRPSTLCRRLCTQVSPWDHDDDANMGKEDKSKSFNLKVPKGTRDCMFFSTVQLSLGRR